MKEYYGKSAEIYKPRKINLYIIMPAINKSIPKTHKPCQKLLDIGCGNGDYFPMVHKKKYEYYGFDISDDMIRIAQKKYPAGNFLSASSEKFSHYYKYKFDIILINMLLPAMESKEKILKTLKEAKKKLKNNGKIIIGIGHPCFNHYMQKYLFGRNDVRVNFQGYFKSGTKFRVPQKFNGNELIFEDYHRTITDYFSYIRASGFTVLNIDECKPITSEDKTINSYLKKFKQFPIYMVFTCE